MKNVSGEREHRERRMRDRVGIVGIATSRLCEDYTDIFYNLSFEVAREALKDAGIDRGDLDNLVLAGYDLAVGRTISNMYTAPAAGGYLKDEIRVSDDGIYALALADMRVRSGFDITMVLAYGVTSECPVEYISNLIADPHFHRPIGLFDKNAAAAQVSAYTNRYNVTQEDAAGVVVKNRECAAGNRKALVRRPITTAGVARSPYDCWPLRSADLPPRADGTCAVILAGEETARRLRSDPVWISGLGWSNDTYYMGDKDLAHLESVRFAARRAYRMSGITDPVKDLDLAEIHENTSYHELMKYEALGFCERGEGAGLLSSGVTSSGGSLPVNMSGGALGGDPLAATGLYRVAEAALQLRGTPQGKVVPDARTALAEGSVGLGVQGSCVVILQKD